MPIHPLVGTVLKGTTATRVYEFPDGSKRERVVVTIDPSEVEMLKAYFGREPRIKMPGFAYTQEYVYGRLNVEVDENLTITEVSNG